MHRKLSGTLVASSALKCAVLGCAVLGSAAVHADSLRCGKWVVSESATLAELVSKCGEPQSRSVTKEDIRTINQNGASVKTGAQTIKERWIYQASSRALPMAVEIVDGSIVAITRAD